MAEETRYWKRLGMRVTKSFALQAAERMNAQGSYHDDDALEFVQVHYDENEAKGEVELLFDSPDDAPDEKFDATNEVLVLALNLHKQRGKKVKQFRKVVALEIENQGREEFLAEQQELGYDEDRAIELYDKERDSHIRIEADLLYHAWYEGEVIKLQKEYGIYEEKVSDEEDVNL